MRDCIVERLPVEILGRVPGRGAEDITQNTTANLFSMCIMANYISPEICVGPSEPSPRMAVFTGSNGYDYTAYDVTNGVYWDKDFKADLHMLSHVSYAHMVLAGERKLKYWRDTFDKSQPIIGNRGPLGGVTDPKSITNRIHRPFDKWTGVIVFSDGHAELLAAFPTLPRNGGGYMIAPECLPQATPHPKRTQPSPLPNR